MILHKNACYYMHDFYNVNADNKCVALDVFNY